MAEYIEREAFLADKKWLYCTDCDKRKGKKRGKMVTLYEIGEAPCKSCGIHDMLEEVEVYPAADVVSAGAYEQTAWERDTAIAQLAEIGKAFGETMDDAIEERKFYEFLWNTIQPNEMEQYISMYRAQGVPSDASREES